LFVSLFCFVLFFVFYQLIKIFKQTPDFKHGVTVILQSVDSKVYAQIMAVFDEIQNDSKDPEILLTLAISDGKLGELPVDSKSLIARESVEGYLFNDWTISDKECEKCCGVGGQVTQERVCKTIANGSCRGILDNRQVDCSDACEGKRQCSSAGKRRESILLRISAALSLSLLPFQLMTE